MSVHPGDLRAVDALEVHVLVDNALDILSTVPDHVTSELPNLIKAGATELSSSCLCCAAWGLSLVITTRIGESNKSLLFDAGPEAYALERNASRLGFDFGRIECVVLSHGHFDHAGGIPKALELITAANGGHTVPTHVNPGMFFKRAARRPDNSLFPLEDVPSPKQLTDAGGEIINADEARLVLDDTVYVSGEIPRVTEYEQGLPKQVRLDDNQSWVPDPLVLDERYLAVHVKNYGVVVFSACSHAGIVNVLTDAAALFDPLPLYGAMGGLHLSGAAQEQWIEPTVRDLAPFGLKHLIGGHCTGWRAIHALVNAFGDVVIPGAIGQTHQFGDAA